ncbi:MAG: DUF885 family protein [Phycisphaerales bacterium]
MHVRSGSITKRLVAGIAMAATVSFAALHAAPASESAAAASGASAGKAESAAVESSAASSASPATIAAAGCICGLAGGPLHAHLPTDVLLAFSAGQVTVPAREGVARVTVDPNVRMDPAAARLFDDYDRWQRREFPDIAVRRGDRASIARMIDESIAAVGRRADELEVFMRRSVELETPAPGRSLSERDRVSLEVLRFELQTQLDTIRFHEHLMPVDPLWGVHQTVGNLTAGLPLERASDYVAFVERLRQVPAWIDDAVARMRVGVADGHVPPRLIMQGIPEQVDDLLGPGGLSSLREPLADIPDSMPERQRAELVREVETEILPTIRVALAEYRRYLAEEYVPACRDTIAAVDAPDGEAWYAARLRAMTTLDLTAEDIHRIGLNEVSRIRAEMDAVIERTDWYAADSSRAEMPVDERFAAFIAFLLNEPRFYHTSADDLMDEYRALCKRIDHELPPIFRLMPRLPYGVEPMADFLAPRQTTAYYQPGSLVAGLPGVFTVNTYRLDQRPRYEMVPLALHEAVPGHHLQIAIAQELDAIPIFRQDTWITAYGEGWALYAERLGMEMDLYEDPYDDFGRLLFEMWRACRLVVDPGMHALGWSRDRAIEFMRRHTALSDLNIRSEVDRYIAWPGQATAYKLGELEIRKLRREAEQKLGAAFDLRDFHDLVLAEACIPLPELTRRVERWANERPSGRSGD